MFKIAALISGGGTDLQSVIDNVENGNINAEISIVISDREGAFGIERAKKAGINTLVLDRKKYKASLSDEILKAVEGADLIVLAGFLSILKGDLLKVYKNRIINIHPSLIPSFCGDGMHGMHVHEAAISYGVKVSGCTVHFVDEGTDTGSIILQKVVPVLEGDTPEMLQKRILEKEHEALPEAVALIADGRVKVEGRCVHILNSKEDNN